MIKNNLCLQTMDEIDNNFIPIEQFTECSRQHIENCRACRNYYLTSRDLQILSGQKEDVNLWGSFARGDHRKPNKINPVTYIIGLSGGLAALMIAVFIGIAIQQNNGSNVSGVEIASNTVQLTDTRNSDYNQESSDVEFIYDMVIDI
jgi:hypothetical protein